MGGDVLAFSIIPPVHTPTLENVLTGRNAADEEEFGMNSRVTNRLRQLSNAWWNTDNEVRQNELHAEANLIRGLERMRVGQNVGGQNNRTVAATNAVLQNNSRIAEVSEELGVPKVLIQSVIFREQLLWDIADIGFVETAIFRARGDASFGLGQVRANTAIRAENAFYISRGYEPPNRTPDQMRQRLQTNSGNVYYVGLVLWHKMEDLRNRGFSIDWHTFENINRLFQEYNGSGDAAVQYGRETAAYVLPFMIFNDMMNQ